MTHCKEPRHVSRDLRRSPEPLKDHLPPPSPSKHSFAQNILRSVTPRSDMDSRQISLRQPRSWTKIWAKCWCPEHSSESGMSLPGSGWEEAVASGVRGLSPFLTLALRDASCRAESCPKGSGVWQGTEGSLWPGTVTLSLEGHPPRGQPPEKPAAQPTPWSQPGGRHENRWPAKLHPGS